MKQPLSPVQELAILLWPAGAAALLTEFGDFFKLQHVPVWVGIGVIVVLPLLIGLIFVYRLVIRFSRFRIMWTVVYALVASLVLPYVAMIVAATNGDAL